MRDLQSREGQIELVAASAVVHGKELEQRSTARVAILPAHNAACPAMILAMQARNMIEAQTTGKESRQGASPQRACLRCKRDLAADPAWASLLQLSVGLWCLSVGLGGIRCKVRWLARQQGCVGLKHFELPDSGIVSRGYSPLHEPVTAYCRCDVESQVELVGERQENLTQTECITPGPSGGSAKPHPAVGAQVVL